MPGLLPNSPAQVVRRLFIAKGWGSSQDQWPVFTSHEPDEPDNCITLYNTVGVTHGRTMIDGERQLHHGLQVRVRAATEPTGYLKINSLFTLIATVKDESITIDAFTYLIRCFSNIEDIIPLREDKPDSRREVYVVNALVSIRKVS
jgi:hypothetical protein